MAAYPCPYTTGAEFVLILSDPAVDQNEVSTCQLHVKVLQIFPFTKSQTMKVAVLNQFGQYHTALPLIAVLKLYDRRYLDERMASGNDPWDHQKEANAETVGKKIRPYLLDPKSIIRSAGLPSHGGNNREVIVSEVMDFDEDDYDDELKALHPAATTAEAIEQWLNEMDYRYHLTSCFKTECRAYRQLRPLQGISVPRFYGATLFDETSQLAPGIHTDVLGILLEYIDGITLKDILSPSTPTTRIPYIHVGEIAVECLKKVTSFGVLHHDVRLANFMVHNDGRVYLLDFGFASFRGQDVCDEEWERGAAEQGHVLSLKMLLDEKELRDQTPPEPYYLDHMGGYRRYNRFIEKAREIWRLKYYEPVVRECSWLSREDENGKEGVVWLPRWVPKHEALVNRTIELHRLRFRYSQMIIAMDSSKK
jgi:serine/threonine protein kinase